jgi:hypothetical protein
MAFEAQRAEIVDLFNTMGDRPEDIHELAALIRERLNELRATGMPLPDDLIALEAEIEAIETAPDAPDPDTVRPSPEAAEHDDPLLESPGPPPE